MFIVIVMSIVEIFRDIVFYFLITGHLIRIFVPLERNWEDFVLLTNNYFLSVFARLCCAPRQVNVIT